MVATSVLVSESWGRRPMQEDLFWTAQAFDRLVSMWRAFTNFLKRRHQDVIVFYSPVTICLY